LKILIAPDKFKGSISAEQVCMSISKGLKKYSDAFKIIKLPLADGGDGSLEVLSNHILFQEHFVEVQDPLGRQIQSSYLTHRNTAYVELATASGLARLDISDRNPMYTSTIGTGMLIVHAIQKGYKHIVLLLGGSSTNDAGIGIAEALGFQFLDSEGNTLSAVGKNLINISSIKKSSLDKLNTVKLDILCDVKNPMFGINGAAFTYAKQKGANSEEVEYLDKGLRHFSKVLKTEFNVNVSELEGGGAAGAISAGLHAMLDGQLISGFDFMSTQLNLAEHVQNCDYIISGEGQLDSSSLQGKVVFGLLNMSKKFGKPLSLFVGNNAMPLISIPKEIDHLKTIMDVAHNKEDAIRNASGYLEKLAFSLAPKILSTNK